MVFYHFLPDPGKRKRFAYAFPIDSFPAEIITCPICKRTWKDPRKLYDTNITFHIGFTNNYFPDFMDAQAIDLVSSAGKQFLFQQNIKDLAFTQMPVTGISELSKEQIKGLRDRGYVIKKLHDEKPAYYRFSVGIGASLHKDYNLVWVDSGEGVCTHCGIGVGYELIDPLAPYFIKLDTWDGTDLFKLKEIGGLFCTENFKQSWEAANLTGAYFKEIETK